MCIIGGKLGQRGFQPSTLYTINTHQLYLTISCGHTSCFQKYINGVDGSVFLETPLVFSRKYDGPKLTYIPTWFALCIYPAHSCKGRNMNFLQREDHMMFWTETQLSPTPIHPIPACAGLKLIYVGQWRESRVGTRIISNSSYRQTFLGRTEYLIWCGAKTSPSLVSSEGRLDCQQQ